MARAFTRRLLVWVAAALASVCTSSPASARTSEDLCCDGPGNCPEYFGGCPPPPPAEVTADIPTFDIPGTAILSVDPNCTDYRQAMIDFSGATCAAITLNGGINGGIATVCFPGPDGGGVGPFQFVSRCDALAAGAVCTPPSSGPLTGAPTSVFHNAAGSAFCCTALGGKPVGNQWCVQTDHFSAFTFGTWIDGDGDGVPNISDNCPFISNPGQSDIDKDLIGDVCDNCPAVPNQDQKRTTGASVGDACNCAVPGVKFGPTGAPCATAVPTLPPAGNVLLGSLLIGLGTFAAGAGRRALRRFG
jgi:hypothetical protein